MQNIGGNDLSEAFERDRLAPARCWRHALSWMHNARADDDTRLDADVELTRAALLRPPSAPRAAPAAALRYGSMAPRLRSTVVRFDALPEPVLRLIMLALPVDERARAACVCRAWRAFLADVSLWHVLDLTPAGGVAAARVTENLARGAVARAAGQLRVLSFRHVPNRLGREFMVPLIIMSVGAELEEVDTDVFVSVEELLALFAAAPRLQVLNAGVRGPCKDLLPVMRNDPPYGPLQVLDLFAYCNGTDEQPATVDDVLAFAGAVAAHDSLSGLGLMSVGFARGTNALIDVAAERGLSRFMMTSCELDTESLTAMARLLRGGSLTKLEVVCGDFPDEQEESMLELCAAIRECHTLTHLKFLLNLLHDANRRNFTELLDAVAELPALSELDLSYSNVEDTVDAGRALGAFLAANPPSLRTLIVEGCELGDQGLAPLLDGLATNTHLRQLVFDEAYENLPLAFKRDRLDPAMAALAARAELDE